MKNVNFFSVFTIVLILGLGAVFVLPHASKALASLPSLNLNPFASKSTSPGPRTATPQSTASNSPQSNHDDTVMTNTNEAPQAGIDSPQAVANSLSLSALDKEAETYYSVSLPILVGVYGAQYKVYINSAEAWNGFVSVYTNVKDPRTGKAPTYTSQAPKVGEIQIISPGACSSIGELQTSTTQRTTAYRVPISNRFLCHSSTGGSVYSNPV